MTHHPDDPAYQEGMGLLCVIRVGGVHVPFFTKEGLAEDDKDDAAGMSLYYPYTHVLIDSGLDEQTQAQTMFHELLHVISDNYGPSLREAQVCCLEQAFTQVLQDSGGEMADIFNKMARPSVAAPVHAALTAMKQEQQADSTPSVLDDRGNNLN